MLAIICQTSKAAKLMKNALERNIMVESICVRGCEVLFNPTEETCDFLVRNDEGDYFRSLTIDHHALQVDREIKYVEILPAVQDWEKEIKNVCDFIIEKFTQKGNMDHEVDMVRLTYKMQEYIPRYVNECKNFPHNSLAKKQMYRAIDIIQHCTKEEIDNSDGGFYDGPFSPFYEVRCGTQGLGEYIRLKFFNGSFCWHKKI